MKNFLSAIFLISIAFFGLQVFAEESKDPNTKQIKILLVPGHDEEVWGAQYGNIKEADMNLVLSKELLNILKKDKRFKVYTTRDSLGYTTIFSDYFAYEWPKIKEFKEKAKEQMNLNISKGVVLAKDGVPHHSVKENVAMNLYGFNKWSGENDIDAVIHIHFNDYPRQNKWEVGKYKGFAVYFPEEQMPNFEKSAPLAKSIFDELKKEYAISTYEKEAGGLLQDQKLIALGANHTLPENTRSVLIEYGYIYRFGDSKFRHKSYKKMAELTAEGIEKYFFGN